MRAKEISVRERDRLLVKHLLGEATPEESEKIQQWIATQPSHRQYADEFRRIWEESRLLVPAEPVDPAAAWERFLESGRLKAPPAGTQAAFTREPINRKANLIYLMARPWSAIAATIILLAAGTYTWWKLDVQPASVTWQSGAAIRIDTLPDGSRVTLNKFSSLELRNGKTSRAVKLSGEAFFEVTHNAHHAFTVQVNDVTIRDVGTGFNVRSTNGTTEIIVETGAVLVTAGSDAGAVKATAGEKVLVTADGAKITRTPVSNRLYQYYRTKSFLCRKTPLSELIVALNEAYGTNIVAQNEAINRLQITATFDNEDLDSILAVITRTFGLNIQKKGGSIILKQP
jgi:transmembrane sensor